MFKRSFSNRHFPGRGRRQNRGQNRFGPKKQAKPTISAHQYVNKAATPTVEEQIIIKHAFTDFQIDPALKQNIATRGYTVPTPIQDQTIPLILEGRDVVGIANTGTGKTAAFLIPLINKIMRNRNEKILIIVPTRELAVQINDEFQVFARSLRIFSTLIMGGANMSRQMSELRQNPQVVIATPGRLKDLITRRLIQLGTFRNIVLDEVDRMVDIGFIRDIQFIIAQLPPIRQSLFFSATVTPEVSSIIKSFVKDAITISVKVKETAQGIEQDIIRVNGKEEKIAKLQAMLRQEEFKKVLIFGRTKWGVEKLSRLLLEKGFSVASIHGNKSQNQRLRALSEFRQNRLQALIATDVVARGLDIDDVSHVINFDEPTTYTDYIHRIGRTGRAQKTGKALTFVG